MAKRKQFIIGLPGEELPPEQAAQVEKKKKQLAEEEATKSWLANRNTLITVGVLFVLTVTLVPLYYWMNLPPARGTISGTVMYNGAPLPGGRITFHPEGKGKAPQSALIDANGKYTVKGCLTGPAKITLETFAPPPKTAPVKDGPAIVKPSGNPETVVTNNIKLLPEYNDPKASPLSYTVTAGSQSKDFTAGTGG
jgi:hypothetical protein